MQQEKLKEECETYQEILVDKKKDEDEAEQILKAAATAFEKEKERARNIKKVFNTCRQHFLNIWYQGLHKMDTGATKRRRTAEPNKPIHYFSDHVNNIFIIRYDIRKCFQHVHKMSDDEANKLDASVVVKCPTFFNDYHGIKYEVVYDDRGAYMKTTFIAPEYTDE
jgi:hypothetical protein